METERGYYQSRPGGPRQAPADGPRTPPSTRGQSQQPQGGGSNKKKRFPQRQGGSNAHFISALIRVALTVVGCVFLAIFILSSASDLFGLNQVDQDYDITIPEGTNIKQLTKILGDTGIVDQKLTFRVFSAFKYNDKDISPGNYVFNSDMAYAQIWGKLKTGNVENQIITLTFIEGLSLDEIAQQLEENGVCDGEEFLEYLQTEDFSSYQFFHLLPEEDQLYLRMEGYIFPDTYQFYLGERVDSVAKKFLSNFDNQMTPERISRMDDINMSLHEIITLASIIQKEAGGSEEMRRVSSVFHNRLDNSANFPQLQSDVTIFYVEDHIKGKNRSYTQAETQELFDSYNTYASSGLPAGPVCNPGVDAIMAALYPAETNYYYFVTDVHEDFYYASDLATHNTNIGVAEQQDESGEGKIGGGIFTRDGEDAQK